MVAQICRGDSLNTIIVGAMPMIVKITNDLTLSLAILHKAASWRGKADSLAHAPAVEVAAMLLGLSVCQKLHGMVRASLNMLAKSNVLAAACPRGGPYYDHYSL